MKKLLVLLLAILPAMAPGVSVGGSDGYLAFDDEGNLTASGPFRFVVSRPDGFEAVGPADSREIFLGENLRTSRAGFLASERFILLEIETTDSQVGQISYSSLPTVSLAGIDFHTRVSCVEFDESESALNTHEVLAFLRSKGYPIAPGQYMRQLLKATDDGKAEGTILFMHHVSSCGDDVVTEEFKKMFDADFEAFLKGGRQIK